MAELHLKGYLCNDTDGIVALREYKTEDECPSYFDKYGDSIIDNIFDFASEYGMLGKHHSGLGGRRAIIDDCNLRVWFTDTECSLEEAMLSLDNLMYGGDIQTKVTRVGYSEYTITGLNLNEFSIGGHDLKYELADHYGEYCHIIIEC